MIILRRRRLGRTSTNGIADKMNNPIKVIRNWMDEIPENTELVFRWGCTSKTGVNASVNTVYAIKQVNDKAGFRALVQRESNGLVPHTEFEVSNWDFDRYPKAIVRPQFHSRGRNIHLVDNMVDAVDACNRYPSYYISEFIDKVEEFRVYVVSGRVVAVAKKTPGNPDDIAWNVAQGGRFDNVRWGDWNYKVVRAAIKTFNLTDLDFGGVDVMFDGVSAYVVEINSAPSLTSEYRQSCFAKAFDYIIENGKERIPLTNELGGWRKFIHPAISKEAICQ